MSQRETTTDDVALTHAGTSAAAEHEILMTLFDLGRQVTAVLDLDELLPRIPQLIARLIAFEAFAVYLLDARRSELKVAYSVGYPPAEEPFRLRLNQGLVGAAITSEQPIPNDLASDPLRRVRARHGVRARRADAAQAAADRGAEHFSRHRDQFTPHDVEILTQFAAHVAIALVNARLFGAAAAMPMRWKRWRRLA